MIFNTGEWMIMAMTRGRRLAVWLGGGVVALVVAVVGGTFLYIHVIEGPAPAPLSLPGKSSSATPSASSAPSGTTATTPGSLPGTWTVRSGSQVGYRVKEVLFGQNNIAVGRTSSISGSMTIKGSVVTAATFTVQMATIRSDQSQRDAQFNGRIMDTSTYPTGVLKLTRPITIAPLPAAGVIKAYTATADLTLHGRTRTVTFTLKAERVGTVIETNGSIPVLFADWGIGNPSFGGAVTTQNHGLLEFLIKLAK
jgi:polyisoprenoid-binding protein YceI